MMEKSDKRSRKRSRKASESEQASEEPPSPPGKTRRRSATGRFGQTEEKGSRSSGRTRNKVLKVSFDIVENNLNVGETAEAVNGSQCSLTLASTAEDTPTAGTENRTRPGNGAGSKNKRDIIKKPPEMKFKNNAFIVSD